MRIIGMVYRFSPGALLLLVLTCWNPSGATELNDADGSYFRLIAATCLTCHSADGHGAIAIPALAGLTAGRIEELLRAYRDDREQATIMNRISKALTDAEIEQVSAILAQGDP